MEETFEACQRLLRFAPEGEVDDYARKRLREEMLEHAQAKKHVLASVFYTVGGKTYKHFLDVLNDAEPGAEISIGLFHPDLNANWDYDTPIKSIVIGRKGFGSLERFSYDAYSFQKWDFTEHPIKDRAMFMGNFTHYHVVESIKTHTIRNQKGLDLPYDPKLHPFDALHAEVREGKVIPFRMRLCGYTQEARHAAVIDLLDDVLVMDFRGGKLPLKGMLTRPPLDCLAFDRVFASEKLPEHVANAFIMVFERTGTTVFDVSQVMGLIENSARHTLGALVARGFVSKAGHPPREIYEADVDAIRKAAEAR